MELPGFLARALSASLCVVYYYRKGFIPLTPTTNMPLQLNEGLSSTMAQQQGWVPGRPRGGPWLLPRSRPGKAPKSDAGRCAPRGTSLEASCIYIPACPVAHRHRGVGRWCLRVSHQDSGLGVRTLFRGTPVFRRAHLAVRILLVAEGVLHFGLASIGGAGEVVISHGDRLWLIYKRTRR